MLAKILAASNQIDKNTNVIRKNICEISVGKSTQIQLAKELNQKLNGVGVFLSKMLEIKQKENGAGKKSRWEDEYN